MNNILETLEQLPKGNQLNILLELLQELGGTVQVLRNHLGKNWEPKKAEELEKERWKCELVKNKIRQLYNENIPDELYVQNIAKP